MTDGDKRKRESPSLFQTVAYELTSKNLDRLIWKQLKEEELHVSETNPDFKVKRVNFTAPEHSTDHLLAPTTAYFLKKIHITLT